MNGCSDTIMCLHQVITALVTTYTMFVSVLPIGANYASVCDMTLSVDILFDHVLCVNQFHGDHHAEEPRGPVQATGEIWGCWDAGGVCHAHKENGESFQPSPFFDTQQVCLPLQKPAQSSNTETPVKDAFFIVCM